MPNNFAKMLTMLDNNIICHCKDITIPVGISMTFHNHDGYEILLMLNGEAEFYTENSAKKMERGDVFLISPYAFHHVHLLDNTCYNRIVLNFRTFVISDLSSEATDLAAIFSRTSSNQINLIHLNEDEINRFLKLCYALNDSLNSCAFGSDILTEAFSKQLLVEINRYGKLSTSQNFHQNMPALITDIFSYIDQHLTEEDFSVQGLANALQYNSSYLNRCFKKIAGTSLQQYIIAKKIALSQEYLRKGYSVSDACYAAGFGNYSNFSRTFSNLTGLSPKQYQLLQVNQSI